MLVSGGIPAISSLDVPTYGSCSDYSDDVPGQKQPEEPIQRKGRVIATMHAYELFARPLSEP